MFKKLLGVFVLMFLMAIAVPVLAQRYDSCDRRGGRSYSRHNDNGRHYGNRGDHGRRNRRSYYGGRQSYAPAYYAPTYYAPSYYVVRRPVRRYYNNGNYRRPHYRGRNRISFRIGF